MILHDATLTRFEVGDRISDPTGKSSSGDVNRRAASVRMFVLSEGPDKVYALEYRSVAKVELNFPGKLELFPVGMHPNFGDWGYDELTAPGKGLFRHEILFASGATIAIEFRHFAFRRKPAKKQTKR